MGKGEGGRYKRGGGRGKGKGWDGRGLILLCHPHQDFLLAHSSIYMQRNKYSSEALGSKRQLFTS